MFCKNTIFSGKENASPSSCTPISTCKIKEKKTKIYYGLIICKHINLKRAHRSKICISIKIHQENKAISKC